MADRSAAEIFGNIFELLLKEPMPTPVRVALAKKVWRMSHNYDFHAYQLEADETLTKLGLAKEVPSSDEDCDCETHYADRDGNLK